MEHSPIQPKPSFYVVHAVFPENPISPQHPLAKAWILQITIYANFLLFLHLPEASFAQETQTSRFLDLLALNYAVTLLFPDIYAVRWHSVAKRISSRFFGPLTSQR